MNAKVPAPQRRTVGFPAEPPRPSADLRSWLDPQEGFPVEWVFTADRSSGVQVMRSRAPLTWALQQEALRLLPDYELAVRGASVKQLEQWLRLLGLAVRNPPEEGVSEVAGVYAMLLSDVPGACFTEAKLREAAQKWEFWPSVADIAKLVRYEAEEVRNRWRVLCFIAALPAPDEA